MRGREREGGRKQASLSEKCLNNLSLKRLFLALRYILLLLQLQLLFLLLLLHANGPSDNIYSCILIIKLDICRLVSATFTESSWRSGLAFEKSNFSEKRKKVVAM